MNKSKYKFLILFPSYKFHQLLNFTSMTLFYLNTQDDIGEYFYMISVNQKIFRFQSSPIRFQF